MGQVERAVETLISAFLSLGPLVDAVILVALVVWLAYRVVARIARTVEYQARRRPLLFAWLLSRWLRR